jgi:hypothetical protein
MSEKIKYKINNAEFEAKFTLTTAEVAPDGGDTEDAGGGEQTGQGEDKINFSKSAIRGMDIEENFLEPFTNGNIYINNPLDFIEDGKLIRGDGRDKFTILFEPVDDGEGVKDEKAPLEYSFVISSELNSASKTDRLNNFKTYRLLDRNYFLLSEQIPYGKRFRGKVGAIIYEILESFGIPTTGEWECGDMEIDVLPEHILPPSTFRYSDLIKYLVKLNFKRVGKTYFRLFLNWCRRCKGYKYLPLSDYFSGTAKEVREGFMVDDLVTMCGFNKNNPILHIGDTPTNVNNAALSHTDLSTPMLVYTNAYLNNILVSGFEPILGEHLMNIIRIKDVKAEWQKYIVDPFAYLGGPAQPWAVLNDVRKTKLFRNLGFPFPQDRMTQLAEAELTSNLTFFNLQLGFQTLGNTDRQPGEFMDVSAAREEEEEEGRNPFSGEKVLHRSDAKLLGEWFITKIRHEFTTAKVDNYTNTIQCIKPHIGPGAELPDDDLK